MSAPPTLESPPDQAPPAGAARTAWRWRAFAVALMGLALLAAAAPLGQADVPARAGVLLLISAAVEILHGFRRSDAAAQRRAWTHGGGSVLLGVFLINAPLLAGSALLLLLAGGLAIEGGGLIAGALRGRDAGAQRRPRGAILLAGLIFLLLGATLLLVGHRAFDWAVAAAVALRILRAAGGIARSAVFTAGDVELTVVADAGLPDTPYVRALTGDVARQEVERAGIDRGWIAGFLVTLLAIHVARMGWDRSVLGIVSPGVAVLGDVFVALVIAFAFVIPGTTLWRRATAPVERRAWAWAAPGGEGDVATPVRGPLRRLAVALLTHRLRSRVRLRQARYSLRTALGRGLQIGLPIAAVIAATTPMWGMSWYFDTENWAAGVWNSWAEQRTDTWREAMVRAAEANRRAPAAAHEAFAVRPPGVPADGPFAFVVIGDPGEGDASQLSLKASLLEVVRQEEVKFLVISSDVVYPTGAMRNYESNFWIPFMGVTKPVYAIPGNHDWYDALEGFAATFFTPEAARTAMRARIETDRRLSSTNEATIERLIAQATRWRQFYGVPTQQQAGPFFQFQTDDFALFAIDTGVARRIDPAQMAWLRAALKSAEGKMKMAILGHPFYAGGRWTVPPGSDFAAIHSLLRQHGVSIVMAGDTHDLEYYRDGEGPDAPPEAAMHHFVNGGGGAYLSFGTALDWPERPDAPAWAYYPNRAAVVAKIDATTPRWKWPAWWWTRKFGGWPFSAEFLSAAFDVNTSPFYQSFVLVRVEPSDRRVTIIPYGVNGRLRWRDLDAAGLPAPADDPNTLVALPIHVPTAPSAAHPAAATAPAVD